MPPRNGYKGRGGRSAQARSVISSGISSTQFLNTQKDGGGAALKAGAMPTATGFNTLYYRQTQSKQPRPDYVFNWKGNPRYKPLIY